MVRQKRKFDITFLHELLQKDNATLTGSYDKIRTYTVVTFVCFCGKEHTKMLHNLVFAKYGAAYCDDCMTKKSVERLKAKMMEKYGVENPNQCEAIREKAKATNRERYGADNPFQSPEILAKIKDSVIQKYGVDNPAKSNIVKEKIEQTNIKKYGCKNALQNKEIQQKLEATSIQRYGCRRPSENTEIRNKIGKSHTNKTPEEREQINQKVIQTSLAKYGLTSPHKSTELQKRKKELSLQKYGTEHPMQSKEVQERIQKNAMKHKDYKMPSGEIRKVQGFEPYALDELLKTYTEDQIKTGRQNIPRIEYHDGVKKRYYFPDIYIPHENKIIEVKSTWTYKCTTDNIELKGKACIDSGYAFDIWIYGNGGKRVNP